LEKLFIVCLVSVIADLGYFPVVGCKDLWNIAKFTQKQNTVLYTVQSLIQVLNMVMFTHIT